MTEKTYDVAVVCNNCRAMVDFKQEFRHVWHFGLGDKECEACGFTEWVRR